MANEPKATEPAVFDRQRIGVIGLGYVGLAETVELARAGFSVTGFEIDEERVRSARSDALTRWQEANSPVAIDPGITSQLEKLGTLEKAFNQTAAALLRRLLPWCR